MIIGLKDYFLWEFVVVIGWNVFKQGNIMLGVLISLRQLIIRDFYFF